MPPRLPAEGVSLGGPGDTELPRGKVQRRPAKPSEDKFPSLNEAPLARSGEVLERLNRRAWRARRGLKPLVGSNPTLSARLSLFLRVVTMGHGLVAAPGLLGSLLSCLPARGLRLGS